MGQDLLEPRQRRQLLKQEQKLSQIHMKRWKRCAKGSMGHIHIHQMYFRHLPSVIVSTQSGAKGIRIIIECTTFIYIYVC